MKNSNKKIYKIFIVLSLFLGSFFSALIPLYQVPDEETHINQLYSFLGSKVDFSEQTNNYGDTTRIITNYNEKVDLNEYINFDKKINILNKINYVDIHIVRYFPQTIGLLISEILNLPIIVSITISEIFAVIFYTLICLIALKKMPIKKELMMMIMLLPIGIQQIGSFSYDMMLMCFSFIFIANIFDLKYKKENINAKDLLLLLGIILIIALIKIPYIILGLLVFILPKNKINLLNKIKEFYNKNKKLKITISIIIFLIILILALPFIIKINYVKVLLSFVINPIGGIKLIIRTLMEYLDFYAISIVGYFGWHDTPVSILFGFFVIIILLITNLLSKDNNEENKLILKERIFLFCLGVFLSLIIIISLFDWTLGYLEINNVNLSIKDYSKYISSIDAILGVQGRYFIPIMPLLLIPIDLNIKKIKHKKLILTIIQVIYYSIMIIYMFLIILKRYWIV